MQLDLSLRGESLEEEEEFEGENEEFEETEKQDW